MKKYLLLLSAAGLLFFFGCNKESDPVGLTTWNVAGQWSFVEDISAEQEKTLAEKLSFIQIKTDGTFTDFDYYQAKAWEGPYTLGEDYIEFPHRGKFEVTDIAQYVLQLRDSQGAICYLQKTSAHEMMLYLEPSMNFGASADAIKSQERHLFVDQVKSDTDEKVEYLYFDSSNIIERFIGYILVDNKMERSLVYVDIDKIDEEDLSEYLAQKYQFIGTHRGESQYSYGFLANEYQVMLVIDNTVGCYVAYGKELFVLVQGENAALQLIDVPLQQTRQPLIL